MSSEQNDSWPVDTLTTNLTQLKLDAERKKLDLEAEKLREEIRAARAQANIDEHDAWVRQQDAQRTVTTDYELGFFYFDLTVHQNTVGQFRRSINEWARRHEGQPLTVDFNSPGGSVLDGLAWYDSLRRVSQGGNHVTTRVAGMAASMAGILLQAGDERVIGPQSWLHLHEVSSIALGKASELQEEAEFAMKLTEQACEIYASRSNLSSGAIHDMIRRHEVWLRPSEALEYGFVDRIS